MHRAAPALVVGEVENYGSGMRIVFENAQAESPSPSPSPSRGGGAQSRLLAVGNSIDCERHAQ